MVDIGSFLRSNNCADVISEFLPEVGHVPRCDPVPLILARKLEFQ